MRRRPRHLFANGLMGWSGTLLCCVAPLVLSFTSWELWATEAWREHVARPLIAIARAALW